MEAPATWSTLREYQRCVGQVVRNVCWWRGSLVVIVDRDGRPQHEKRASHGSARKVGFLVIRSRVHGTDLIESALCSIGVFAGNSGVRSTAFDLPGLCKVDTPSLLRTHLTASHRCGTRSCHGSELGSVSLLCGTVSHDMASARLKPFRLYGRFYF